MKVDTVVGLLASVLARWAVEQMQAVLTQYTVQRADIELMLS